jgi:hypothetical protein
MILLKRSMIILNFNGEVPPGLPEFMIDEGEREVNVSPGPSGGRGVFQGAE